MKLYSAVILILALPLCSPIAVMVVFPAFIAVTLTVTMPSSGNLPVTSTTATELSSDINAIFSVVSPGSTVMVNSSSLTTGQTKPKPLHTEASLLAAMETCGKDIEDDEMRQAIKDCGIGTPATRAAIIETLFARGYVVRADKSLVPTEKGLALYYVVKEMQIADVAMTGEWEQALAKIERGEMDDRDFRRGIEEYTSLITSELLSCQKIFGHKESECTCPKCGTGKMQFFHKVVRCDNKECGLPIFRQKAGKDLTDDEMKELITNGKTGVLKGFKSKQGKKFSAIVAFDSDFNTQFIFPK